MKTAADFLHRYQQLIDKCAASDLLTQDAQQLMQKAQAALARCYEFQSLLDSTVPERWRDISQQRLLRRLHCCDNPARLSVWCQLTLEKIVASLEIDEVLIGIIQQIQSLPPQSRDRRNLITLMLTKIQSSGKVTTHIPNLPSELYSEALHETMLWFCEHIDEYDPAKAGPVVWFNRNLFYAASKINRARYRSLPNKIRATEEMAQLEGAPDAYEPLIEEAEYQILEELYRWVREDKTGQLKRTAISDRQELNAQTIIKAILDHIFKLRSLSKAPAQLYEMFSDLDSEASSVIAQPTDLTQLFTKLAERWQYPYAKLRRFWRERCQPHIGDFLQQSGNQ